MKKIILPRAQWDTLSSEMKSLVPEAFDSQGNILNLIKATGRNREIKSCSLLQ